MPCFPPNRTKDRYLDKEVRPPVNANSFPPFHGFYPKKKKSPAVEKSTDGESDISSNAYKQKTTYFESIAAVDEDVGRILKALDNLHLSENTVILFTTDNGRYRGEHGLEDKRSAYEDSLRVPLLVRYPKLDMRGKIVDEMVLNIDFAPTFLDFADVPIPSQMQGISLRSLLEGKPVNWRKAFFYEYFYERGYREPTILAIRTETAKLIQYPGHDDWTELFDLQNDPDEMHNLANDSAHKELLNQMKEEFDRQAKQVDFKIPNNVDKPRK